MIKSKVSLLLVFLVAHSFAMDTRKVTSYLSLCTEFWDLDKPNPPADEYAFYRHYVAKSRGPILEPMCGTGRHLIPLLEEGFNVEGVDASPFMINALRNKCAQKNLSAHAWVQFLEDVPATKQYNLIFIPDTSFSLFTDMIQIKKNLQKIYSLLKKGGTFVFDVQTSNARWGQIGIWTGNAYKNADGNTLIESMLPLTIKDSMSPLIIRYELMNDTEILRTEMEHFSVRLYEQMQMDALLKEAGFRKIKRIKGYKNGSKPSPEDVVIVYECIK